MPRSYRRGTVFRFLLSPRWIGLFVVVVVLGYTCVRLSEWQFSRYRERHDSNSQVRTNIAAPPAPIASLLNRTTEPDTALEWRRVVTSGHYDASHQIAILYRTRSGNPGVNVVTPLVTSNGTAVLVDRGWIPTAANGNIDQHLPAPTPGTVTVTGWIRVDSRGGSSQVTPSQGSVRAVSAAVIAPTLAYPLYRGFIELVTQSPADSSIVKRDSSPSLGGGPSFFYGWQWLFFALLFFGFYCYFAYAEYQEKVKGKVRKGPTRASTPMGARPPPRQRRPTKERSSTSPD